MKRKSTVNMSRFCVLRHCMGAVKHNTDTTKHSTRTKFNSNLIHSVMPLCVCVVCCVLAAHKWRGRHRVISLELHADDHYTNNNNHKMRETMPRQSKANRFSSFVCTFTEIIYIHDAHTHEIRTKKFSFFLSSFVCVLANVLFALCGERFGMWVQRVLRVSVDFGCLPMDDRQRKMFTFGQKVLLSQSECETVEKCQVQLMGGFVHLFSVSIFLFCGLVSICASKEPKMLFGLVDKFLKFPFHNCTKQLSVDAPVCPVK